MSDAELDDFTPIDDINLSELDKQLAMFFMKLEVIYKIPVSTINTLICDLRTLHELSVHTINTKMRDILTNHSVADHERGQLLHELSLLVTSEYPLYKHTFANDFLSTAWKREKYIKDNLNFVEPVEYLLGLKNGKKCYFTYVPILETLKCLPSKPDVLDFLKPATKAGPNIYASPLDGMYMKNNELFSACIDCIRIGTVTEDVLANKTLWTTVQLRSGRCPSPSGRRQGYIYIASRGVNTPL